MCISGHLLGQHEADIPGPELVVQPPVVQVVLKVAIADAKLEILEKLSVVHQVQAVEHLCVYLKYSVVEDFANS